MWFFRKKMPDAVLFWHRLPNGDYARRRLVHTYVAAGRRWCNRGGEPVLLREDGSVVGDDLDSVWEAL